MIEKQGNQVFLLFCIPIEEQVLDKQLGLVE